MSVLRNAFAAVAAWVVDHPRVSRYGATFVAGFVAGAVIF